MATVTKDFRIKSGLVVEGANGTINGSNILTEASTTFLENYVKDTAGGLLENATLTNIQITYDDNTNGLVITAENGVADSNTDQLAEGSANLYFTVDRAQDAVGELLASGSHNGIEFTYDDTTNTLVATVTGASVPTFSTGIVFEGGAPDNFETTLQVTEPTQDNTITLKNASGTLAFESDITDAVDALSTDDIEEGVNNLYFTEQRAIDAVGGSATSLNTPNTVVKRDGNGDFAAGTISANLTGDVTGTVSSIANHDTDDLAEGTSNLYYTDTRARGAVSAGDGLDYNSSTGVFSADLGYGLQIDINGQIEIDDNVVATDTDVTTAVNNHSALTTGVHGVTGDVVGTTDTQTLENKALGTGTTLSANLDADGFTITGLATPTQGTDAATKQYVDGISAGLTWKAAVNLLANTNVNINSPASWPATPGIDGHAEPTEPYRVLLTAQTVDSENGIWVYTPAATPNPASWTRATDADDYTELDGAAVFVMEGDQYGSTSWVQSNHYLTDFTGQEWDQFSGAGTYIAGNGLTLTGNEFAIDETVTATRTFATGEVSTHAGLTTGVHGVTGTIVGTSDQQTLSNKVLGTNVDLGADLDAASNKVVNLADPTANQDAATKKYVDDEITGVNSTINSLNTDDIAELSGATNLYFTNARAVSALEAVVPNFTEVDINDVATQVAATATVTDAPTAVYTFPHATYRTAKFLVKTAYGSHTQVSEILLTLDSSNNVAITEYAIVGTNGNIADVTADVSGADVRVVIDAVNASTSVTVAGTLLK